MKIIIAALIASAFSLGAVAQTTPAMGASAPMAKKDAAAKPMDSGMTKAAKPMKKHSAKKAMKKTPAPA